MLWFTVAFKQSQVVTFVEFTDMLNFCKLCNTGRRVPFEFVLGGCTFAVALLGQFYWLVVKFLS